MPARTELMAVDTNNVKRMDDISSDSLFGMWTVFSKCSESLENGRRLENMSWRLWNKETFCLEDTVEDLPPTAHSSTEDMPELSASVESIASDKYERHLEESKSDKPLTLRRDSTERGRGKASHITPGGLVNLMHIMSQDNVRIAKDEYDLQHKGSPPTTSPQPTITSNNASEVTGSVMSTCSDRSSSSQTSDASQTSQHSIARGFVASSYRSSSSLNIASHNLPELKTEVIAPAAAATKGKPTFFIGSSSGSDRSASFSDRYSSVLSSSLKKSKSTSEKHTSFMTEVSTRTHFIEEEDDDEITDDEDLSESAIEDDDDADWDSDTESASNSYQEENLFLRKDVESPKPLLVSRRSLLSTLLHQGDRAAALAKAGSRSTPIVRSRVTSPNGPSLAPSPSQDSPLALAQAKGLPISTRSSSSSIAHPVPSPRTTRRHMLQTELTESLRKGLLWERQQKNPASTALLKRRHTTQDLTKLADVNQADTSTRSSYDRYFDRGLQEYHVAGW